MYAGKGNLQGIIHMNTSCPHSHHAAICLLFAALFLMSGCGSAKDKDQIKAVVEEELDILKALGNGEELSAALSLPDSPEVFRSFYRDFDYRILNIKLDRGSHTAVVKVSLKTLDARVLAKDLKAEELRREILHNSIKNRLSILHTLLLAKEYQLKDRLCDIRCTKEKEGWSIIHTASLENELSGGFLSALADPELLRPEEVCEIQLKALKEMDTEDAVSFLGHSFESQGSNWEDHYDIARVLAEEYLASMEYRILDTRIKGYQASVTVEITAFDEEAVLKSYQSSLDTYLHSAAAVIDGEENRERMSLKLLKEAIRGCKETKAIEHTFDLYNDGSAWKLSSQ